MSAFDWILCAWFYEINSKVSHGTYSCISNYVVIFFVSIGFQCISLPEAFGCSKLIFVLLPRYGSGFDFCVFARYEFLWVYHRRSEVDFTCFSMRDWICEESCSHVLFKLYRFHGSSHICNFLTWFWLLGHQMKNYFWKNESRMNVSSCIFIFSKWLSLLPIMKVFFLKNLATSLELLKNKFFLITYFDHHLGKFIFFERPVPEIEHLCPAFCSVIFSNGTVN